ncbi:unnamed protein product [Parnassius mnemosyne]|uniref:Hexosyltransferase n=1 Tax=Parnassius mnemosyne TaxID=213953 RepID=A0AAV1LWQ7_9NEOP
MLKVALKRYRTLVLFSIFFFYLGCCLTLSFLRIDCTKVTVSNNNVLQLQDDTIILAEYIVLIVSSPSNQAKRDAVRATWSKFVNNIFIDNGQTIYKWNYSWTTQNSQHGMIKIYFAVGTQGLNDEKIKSLRAEQKHSKDLLFLNIEDNYQNLSLKNLKAIKWFSKNVKGMKYLIKCDDDSFVRIDLIVKDLEAFAPNKGLYWGYFNGHANVYLNGKWQERTWFLCDKYLPYALGGGYVISRSIVDYIANNSNLLSYYNSEDVSMGVWTAALDINRVHDIRFDTEWKSRGCNKTMLVRHKQSPSDMFEMYETLVHSHGEKLCKTEDFKRKTYFYNWNVLPSMCCSSTQN